MLNSFKLTEDVALIVRQDNLKILLRISATILVPLVLMHKLAHVMLVKQNAKVVKLVLHA